MPADIDASDNMKTGLINESLFDLGDLLSMSDVPFEDLSKLTVSLTVCS